MQVKIYRQNINTQDECVLQKSWQNCTSSQLHMQHGSRQPNCSPREKPTYFTVRNTTFFRKAFFEIPRTYLNICGIHIGNRQITLPFLSIFFIFKTVDLTLRNTPAQSCVFSWQATCTVSWKKACKNLFMLFTRK